MGIGYNILIGFLILFLLYFTIEFFNYISKVRYRNKWLKIEREEKKNRREMKISGKHIINRPEFSDNAIKVLTRAVEVSIKDFESTYLECDEVRIFTQSMLTFQLQCRLEKAYSVLDKSEEDIKEYVRNTIKLCHLEAVRLYPELKEY